MEIEIQPYIGYGYKNRIYCYGRVLKKRTIYKKNNYFFNLINSYKRIESDEIPNCEVTYTFNGISKKTITNSEGFYLIDDSFSENNNLLNEIITFSVNDVKSGKIISASGLILFPDNNAKYAIISDIDDTILHTNVLSFLKIKVLLNSFLISANKRKTIKDTPNWYQQLYAKHNNSFFYISHSPWNLYDYLLQFIQTHKYPKGIVLLRDFGKKAKDALQNYSTHKKDETEKLINLYPHLQFVLIGDGGEKDADIYLELYNKFPNRIKAIFIHRLGNLKHQARIEELLKGKETYFYFIKDVNEALIISKQIGIL